MVGCRVTGRGTEPIYTRRKCQASMSVSGMLVDGRGRRGLRRGSAGRVYGDGSCDGLVRLTRRREDARHAEGFGVIFMDMAGWQLISG